jgi:sugar phosphate permease
MPRDAWPHQYESGARWRVLALLATAELLGMSLWFTANAVAPQLTLLWKLSSAETAWLTAVVQLGFVAGTAVAAVLNLADLVPPRTYFAAAALLAAAVNAALVVLPDYGTALLLRFLTGFFLAGVYPPVMKMAATWFRAQRGLAIGAIVGALTVGKAAPYLFRAAAGDRWQAIVLGASAAAVIAAALVAAAYREGPHAFERRPFSWSLVRVVAASRETRLAIGGYLGHMWELYGMWTWTPAFLAASCAGQLPAGAVDAIAFGTLAAGGLGCVWGGWEADRLGRARLVNIAMAASGACALGIGLVFGQSPWIVAPLAWTWGFFVVADSAQFSAMVTEAAPPHAVGTALTLQTSLGFLLSMATIQAIPAAAEAWGWPWAFTGLAIGPALGILAIARLSGARSGV